MKECPYSDKVDDYVNGRLSERERDRFEDHYIDCEMCLEDVSNAQQLKALFSTRRELHRWN